MTTSARAALYASLSHHLIDESQHRLDRGDITQASEKCWGAAAHAIKSVAQTRGWNHHRHDLLRDVVTNLALEWERYTLMDLFDSASILHQNFYEYDMDAEEVQYRINRVRTLVAELDAIRDEPPRPFVLRTAGDRRRWRKLTRPDRVSLDDDIENLPPIPQSARSRPYQR